MSEEQEDDPWKGVPFEQRLIIWQRELAQHRNQLEQHRNQLEQNRIHVEAVNSSVLAAITFAGAAIKGLILINGGAAIAILAFLGHVASTPELTFAEFEALGSALIAFGWGALAGAMTAGSSYLSQIYFSEVTKSGSKCAGVAGKIFRLTAVALAIFGYGVFVYGLYTAASAFGP